MDRGKNEEKNKQENDAIGVQRKYSEKTRNALENGILSLNNGLESAGDAEVFNKRGGRRGFTANVLESSPSCWNSNCDLYSLPKAN